MNGLTRLLFSFLFFITWALTIDKNYNYSFSSKAIENVSEIVQCANSSNLNNRISVLEQLIVRNPASDTWLYQYAYNLPPEDYYTASMSVLEGGLFSLKDVEKVRDIFGKISQAAIQFKLTALLPETVKFIEYDDPIVQIQTLMILERLEGKQYAKEIVKASSSPNIDVSRPALRILMKFDSKEAAPVLIDCLKKEENFGTKMNAIEALGRIGDRSAIPHLIPMLKTELYPWTLDTLISLDAQEALPFIKELYKPGELYENRTRILISLAYFGDERAISDIIAEMTDEKFYNGNPPAESYLEQLVEKNVRPVIPALIEVLEQEQSVGGHTNRGPNVIHRIMISLARLEAKEAIPVLRLYLKPQTASSDLNSFLSGGTIEALSILQDKEIVPQLIQMLDSNNNSYWYDATMALARIGEPSTIESLIAALRKRQPNAHHVQVLNILAFTLNPNTYKELSNKLPQLESLPIEEYLKQLNEKGNVKFSLSENIPLPDEIKHRIVVGRTGHTGLSDIRRILVGNLNYSSHKYTIFIDEGIVRFVTIEEAYNLWENWAAEYKRTHPENSNR